ncbi:hypothetical protein [Alloyangia pacifica]|uniref:hypothetical protein n=1 Tax=Alloyangia pacifica TaxID=311180 RepID=UPI001CD2CD4D|nr:hypothetical protein [Alloyangia pacifica]MCA0997328.1 hypothetical protein [Alloyangia pacifica]
MGCLTGARPERLRSAEPVVRSFAARFPWPVRYVSEPEPGIPIARNRAILRQSRYGITRANMLLPRRPLGCALLHCTMSGAAMLGIDVLKLPAVLVKGRAGLADGVALIARGTGVFSGAMGRKRQEYAR